MPERIRRPLVCAYIALPWLYTAAAVILMGWYVIVCVWAVTLMYRGYIGVERIMAEGALVALIAFLLSVFRDIVAEGAREAPLVVLMNPDAFPGDKLKWAISAASNANALEFFRDLFPEENLDRLIFEARVRLHRAGNAEAPLAK